MRTAGSLLECRCVDGRVLVEVSASLLLEGHPLFGAMPHEFANDHMLLFTARAFESGCKRHGFGVRHLLQSTNEELLNLVVKLSID